MEVNPSVVREETKLTYTKILKMNSGIARSISLSQATADESLFKQIRIDAVNLYSFTDINSTAEIAANSPRYRRRSSTFIDGVHDLPDDRASPMAPAQLYSTMSGRLFHSGRIAIVLVGPPARGKT